MEFVRSVKVKTLIELMPWIDLAKLYADGFRLIAMDKDLTVFAYTMLPRIVDVACAWRDDNMTFTKLCSLKYLKTNGSPPWKESLCELPKPEPRYVPFDKVDEEWCGEVVKENFNEEDVELVTGVSTIMEYVTIDNKQVSCSELLENYLRKVNGEWKPFGKLVE
jgi:hypothetical protein